MSRPQEDDTAYMRAKWRCSACGGINSMEFGNVCQHCCGHIPMKAALDDKLGCIKCGKWLGVAQ